MSGWNTATQAWIDTLPEDVRADPAFDETMRRWEHRPLDMMARAEIITTVRQDAFVRDVGWSAQP